MGEEKIRTDSLSSAENTRFLILVASAMGERHARLLIESLRTFGGRLSRCPVWVFLPHADRVSGTYSDLEDVYPVPLVMEDEFRNYLFADKVYACAQAETMAGPEVRSLVWLSPQCLIVNAPVLFDLIPAYDAAFRPVHIKNVGSPAEQPPDEFWKGVYRTVGVDSIPFTVESFVDTQKLRPYFNTHCFSTNPAKGVLRTWLEYFKTMFSDRKFQSGPCRDEDHQVFLHQAILSALVGKSLDPERIRVLPPEYNYPLNFHRQVPSSRRARTLNALVSPVYEEVFHYPDTLMGLEVNDPLRSWLAEHAPTRNGT